MRQKAICILTILSFAVTSCNNSGKSVLTDKYYSDTINQKNGGKLIRDIHYWDTFHSWDYEIKYSYKDKFDSIYVIGSGNYHGQEIPKDDQLIQVNKWTIFKTSRSRDADVIFVWNKNSNTWTEYEISPETIEQTDIWKKQKINSQLDNWDTVSKIKKIDENGNITVLYTFAKKNRIFSFITSKRQINYRINLQTGRPELTEILDI
jgi:hypothetical protein